MQFDWTSLWKPAKYAEFTSPVGILHIQKENVDINQASQFEGSSELYLKIFWSE